MDQFQWLRHSLRLRFRLRLEGGGGVHTRHMTPPPRGGSTLDKRGVHTRQEMEGGGGVGGATLDKRAREGLAQAQAQAQT